MTDRRSIVACQDCDALQSVGNGLRRIRAICFRCGAVVVHGRAGHIHRALAFALASIPLFIAANILPLVRMEGRGNAVDATVIGALDALLDQRLPALASLVLVTIVLLPAVHLACTVYLLSRLAARSPSSAATPMLQVLEAIRPWMQIEILLFGIAIAFGRLASLFHVVPGLGVLCMAGFLLLGAGASASLDARRFWETIGAPDAGAVTTPAFANTPASAIAGEASRQQ